MTEVSGPSRKGPAAFRTISEASAELGVPQHVLRFWETRFSFVSPMKRAGGRRFYRPQDLDVLRGVRTLLQEEGYTIKGVQKLHKDHGLKRLVAASGVGEAAAARVAAEVEAQVAAEGAASAAEPTVGAAPLRTAPPDVADDVEPGCPDTADLFGQASEPPPPLAGPSVVATAPSRPVLDAEARRRLAEVLGDLETTKAGIDALLHES